MSSPDTSSIMCHSQVCVHDAVIGPHLRWGPLCNQPTDLEYENAVTERIDEVDLVIDDEGRGPFVPDLRQEIVQIAGLCVVESGAGFVEHEYPRRSGESPCQFEQPLLPICELAGWARNGPGKADACELAARVS